MILFKDVKEDEYIDIDVLIVDNILKSPKSGQILSIKLNDITLSKLSRLNSENLSLSIGVDATIRGMGETDSYGEDADGNRGIKTIEPDEDSLDFTIHEIKVFIYDDSGEVEVEELASEELIVELVKDKLKEEEDLEVEV